MKLNNSLSGKDLRVISTNFDDEQLALKLTSIGVIPNEIIRINLHSKLNSTTVYLVVREVEYAVRASDAEKIEVEIVNAGK